MSGTEQVDFAKVYSLHALAVHATARRVLGDAQAAEDVVQEVFLEFWRRPEAYDPRRGALRSWLCAVARNKAIDLVRRADRHSAALAALAETDLSEDAAEPVMRKALAESVRDAIESLPATHRTAIVLAYYRGFTYRQVALTLSIPEGTAKSRVRLGLRRLNALLASAISGEQHDRGQGTEQHEGPVRDGVLAGEPARQEHRDGEDPGEHKAGAGPVNHGEPTEPAEGETEA